MNAQRFLLLLSLATLAAYGQTPPTPPANSRVGIFRQGFYWILDVNGNNIMDFPPDIALPFGGVPGDIPITGDWNGDGFTEVGIYRPSNGLFILDTNGNGQLDAEDQVFSFWPGGLAGAIPVVGDWNGDGRTKVGLFYQGYEWILDYNGDGAYEAGIDKVYAYGGIAGDIPVVGDWTGTGTSKIGIFRPSSSGGPSWLLDANGDGVFAGADFLYYFGSVGDVPVVGDWSGSGTSKIGVFRYGNTWILDSNGDGIYEAGDSVFPYGGVSGDVPVVGKWNASEQSTDTQPVCVSSSGSCTATPQGQALPVMNTNVVSTPPPAPNPPYFLLTTQFIAQSTNANVASTVAGGQILVNVDTTTPPAALNGCYITWSVPLAVNSIAMPDAAAPAAESTGFGAGNTQFVYDNNCGVVGSGSSLTSSTTSNTSNGVTTYTATFTVTLALYFQPGFSGPHAVYASGTTTGGSPSPWINLGMLGVQPPPAMPAITTLLPQYVTLAPSASNTQIPLAYLGFNTSSSSDPITLSAAPVSDSNGNMLTATFQQSPATGSTTMTMSASANMRPGSYTMIVMGRDTTTGATSSRDVSATITSSPTLFISSDGIPVYITDLPNGDTCTGGDSTFGVFSEPDQYLAGYSDWSGYSIGGGANRYQINCSGLIYNINVLTPGPPLIYDVQMALTGNTPTCSQTLPCNSVAVDSSGSLDLPGENLTANSQTPYPAITSDDPNISFSLLWANPGYAVVNYIVGPNAATGLHTLTLTTIAGDATQGYIVGDAYPVLTSIPPGTFQANSIYYYVTINGMHLGTGACPAIAVSGGASFTSLTNCTDTSVTGTLQTGDPGTITFSATGYGYGSGFAPQTGAVQPPGLIAQVTQPLSCSSPQITSLVINGQNTNTVVFGSMGTILVNGCLLSGTTSATVPPSPSGANSGVSLTLLRSATSAQVSLSYTSQTSGTPGMYSLTLMPLNISFQIQIVAPAATITAILPARGMVGYQQPITIAGGNLGTAPPTMTASGGITVSNISTPSGTNANGTGVTATLNIPVSAAGGNVTITLAPTTGNSTPATTSFFVQIPTSLKRANYPGGSLTAGYGTLQTPVNQPILNAAGQQVQGSSPNSCGVYRNLGYSVVDQENPPVVIQGPENVTVAETFSMYVGPFSQPQLQTYLIDLVNSPYADVLDTISFAHVYPTCLQTTEHETFSQGFTLTYAGRTFPLTLQNSIARGNFSGTLKTDVNISQK